MTTARLKKKTFQKVKPTQSLGCICGKPMPCEKQCAEIRNNTIDHIKNNRMSHIACHYLLNKQGEKNTFKQVAFFGVLAGVELLTLLYLFNSLVKNQNTCSYQEKNTFSLPCEEVKRPINKIDIFNVFLLSYCFLFSLANVLPNISNTRRYRETKLDCEKWLKQRVNPNCLKDITKLSGYNLNNLFQLKEIFKKNNFNTDVIDEKIERKMKI